MARKFAWQTVSEAGLAWLYPHVCQLCEREPATPTGGFVGARCRKEVHFIEPPICQRCGLPFPGNISNTFECSNCHGMELHFTTARSAVAARGTALEIIHRFKYHRALWFGPYLAELLVGVAAPALQMQPWDCLVPVPLHPLKQREREFNQAEHLARPLAQALKLPLRTDLLQRRIATRTQTLLTKTQRADNVRRAFAARPNARLHGERIILVDDVLTTGATTSACARVLRDLGAGEVCVWTVARGL
ncbi:MAG TPA: ComF family protein [Verrucomicrobiota bacterium]|nr:ComF family protein [Verrucomicrobiota bacterium]HNT15848.1 ComF family protein [Verrucomicrobiota bacterium]